MASLTPTPGAEHIVTTHLDPETLASTTVFVRVTSSQIECHHTQCSEWELPRPLTVFSALVILSSRIFPEERYTDHFQSPLRVAQPTAAPSLFEDRAGWPCTVFLVMSAWTRQVQTQLGRKDCQYEGLQPHAGCSAGKARWVQEEGEMGRRPGPGCAR